MQINHLAKVRKAINSWINRSTCSCVMRNEGFVVYNGSSLKSRNYISYQAGHGRPYSIDFESSGKWSDDFSKTFTLSAEEDKREGWLCDAIPRILLANVLEQVERYLPLPKWTEGGMLFISWPNAFRGYDLEGQPVFYSERQWNNKFKLGVDPELNLYDLVREYKEKVRSLIDPEAMKSDREVLQSEDFLKEARKYQVNDDGEIKHLGENTPSDEDILRIVSKRRPPRRIPRSGC